MEKVDSVRLVRLRPVIARSTMQATMNQLSFSM